LGRHSAALRPTEGAAGGLGSVEVIVGRVPELVSVDREGGHQARARVARRGVPACPCGHRLCINIDRCRYGCQSVFVTASVEAFLDEYIRRYTAGDVRGVTNLCHVPFVAIRRGEAIHMPDSGAVWDHFAAAIDAYRRASGVETWSRLETDTRQLGEHSVFASVHWNALDANEKVVRDTWTSYQLLDTPAGWQLLSYTNHF